MRLKLPLKSIAQKVLLSLAISIVLVMSVAGVLYYKAEKNKAVMLLRQTAAQTSERLSNSLIYPLWNVSTAEIEKTLNLEMADENLVAIVLYDEFDKLLIGRTEDAQGRITNYVPQEKGGSRVPDTLIVVRKKVLKGSEYLGEVRLYFTDRNLNRYLDQLTWEIILLTALLALFSIIIIYYTLDRIVLNPLISLQQMTQRLRSALGGSDTPNRPFMGEAADEIDLLGRNFDAMAKELTQSQGRLRQTAEHLQTLTDETPDAVASLNDSGKIIDVNKTFLEIFGQTREDVLDKLLFDLGSKNLSTQIIQRYLDQALIGEAVEFEWQAQRKSSTSFTALVRLRLMHTGEDRRLLAVMTDITERKHNEEALRQSEAKYRRLVEKLGREYFFYTHDTAGVFTYLSPSASDMLGYTPDELKTHYATYLTDAAINQEAIEKTNLSLQGIKQPPYQAQMRNKSGCPVWLEVSESPIFDVNSRVVAVEGIAHDITAIKLTQEALRESELRFRRMFEHHQAVMLIIEPETGAIMNANAAATAYYGYAHDQLCNMHIQDINQLPPEEVALEREKASAERRNYFIFPHRLSDGEVRWAEVYSTPFETQGKRLLFSIVHDITDRRHAEQALRESEERFSKAFLSNPAPMAITKIETGLYLDANDRWLNLTGYSREELIGHTSVELNVYADTGTRERLVALLRKEGFLKEADLRLRRKSGQIVDVLWTAEIINLGGQEAMLSVFIDITERKLTEKRLLESMGLLQATLESAADGILVTNLNAHIVNYNQRFVELMQIPPEIPVSGDDHAVLKVILNQLKEPEGFLDSLRHLYDHPEVEHHEVNRFLDGRIFERHSIPTYRGNEIVGRVWSFRDVTETRKAEEALLLTQFSVDRASESILWLDEDANLIYANDAVCTALGYTREELLSMNIHALDPDFPPEAWPPHVEELRRRKAITFESGHRTKDGRIFPVEVTCNYFEYNGHFYSFSFDRDITLRKQAEEALKASETQFRTLVKNVPGVVYRCAVDSPWKVFYISEGIQSVSGYTQEVFSNGMTLGDLILPEDRGEVERIVKKAVERQASYELEYRIRCADGQIKYVYETGQAFIGPLGTPLHLDGVILDNTERKQAETQVLGSLGLLQATLESTADGILVTDLHRKIVNYNRRFAEMWRIPDDILSSGDDRTVLNTILSQLSDPDTFIQGVQYLYDRPHIEHHDIISFLDGRIYERYSIPNRRGDEITGRVWSFRDVTSERKGQEALRESEALFRSQFEYGNIGIAITSVEKGWLRINQYICDLFGYTEEELKEKTWAEMTHPEDLEADLSQFNHMLAEEIDAYEMDKRFIRKDGEIVITHLSVSCFRNLDRSVRFVIASLLDITENTRAVERLRTSETTIRALMNATADALFVTDTDGRLLALNETLSRRFGRSVDDMMETSIYEYLPSDVAQERRFFVNQVIDSGQPVNFVDQRRGMWLENTFYPIFNSSGTVVMLAAYSRDITLRKQAERELQEYQEHLEEQVKQRTWELSEANATLIRFRRFAEASGQGFGMATLDGKIIYANATLRRLINDGKLNGTESISFLDRYPEEYRSKLQDEILPQVLEDKQWIGELALVTTSSRIIPTIENYFLIRDEVGNPSLIADVVTDIQDMKRTENELRKYRDHLEELVKKRTVELQKLNKDLQKEIIIRADAENALRASEQRYRTLFDNAPIGISIMKRNMSFDYFNPRFTEMFGYSLADIPDKNAWFQKAYPDPNYRRHVRSLWKDDLLGNTNDYKLGERILRVRTKAGHEKTIHFRTAVLENGEHLMSYEDVTELQNLNDKLREEIAERVLAEEALRESEARYRTLFDGAPVGISVTTADGAIVAANEGLVKLLKASSLEEAFGTNAASLYLSPGEREELLERITREGLVHDYETRLKTLDGTIKDVLMTLNRFTYAGKDAIMAVIQDITWKKQAEEETRHLKNYLANIIDSMPSVLVGVDVEGQVTQWNTAAEETTGIGADLARGRHLEQVLPLLSHHIDLIRQAMRANKAQTFPRLQSAVKGENRFLDVTVYPLVSNGVSGAVVRVDDVTERIRMEEMMIQSEKMLSVGGLAAGMAHEINNPLGIIMAASQNVVRRIAPDLAANLRIAETCGVSLPAIRDYLEKRQVLTFLDDIRNGVVRANQIVTNMLSFSRRPSEGGALENMAELLDQTLLLAASDYDLKKKYDFRQIHVERDYDPETPKVFCQASKIQQVFLNILRNGAEAMEENRSSKHPPCFKLRVCPDQDRVRIEIRDNGPGMEESTRRRIFEPFFTTKPPGVGTGLGLSVSYFIITQNHDGAISVESGPGEGTCFIIELPVKEYSV